MFYACLAIWCDQEDLNLHSFELEPKSSASAKASQTALHFDFCLTPKALPFVCLLLFPKNVAFLGTLSSMVEKRYYLCAIISIA